MGKSKALNSPFHPGTLTAAKHQAAKPFAPHGCHRYNPVTPQALQASGAGGSSSRAGQRDSPPSVFALGFREDVDGGQCHVEKGRRKEAALAGGGRLFASMG